MNLKDRTLLTKELRDKEPGLSPAEIELRLRAIEANDREQREHFVAKLNPPRFIPREKGAEFPNDDQPF